MAHFMQAYITIWCLPAKPFHKIIPGKINAGLIYMAHKRARIKAIMIVIAKHKNIIEISQHEFFQPERKLHGNCTDEYWHFCTFFHFYVMKMFGVFKKISSE